MGADCKSAGVAFSGSNPLPATSIGLLCDNASVGRRVLLIAITVILAISVIPTQANVNKRTHTLTNGVDISWLPDVENVGGKFFVKPGLEKPALKLLQSQGIHIGRVRVWVDKEDGQASLQRAIKLAKRLHANEMQVLLDFHLSDTWADPGNQQTPSSWATTDRDQLKARLVTYIEESMSAFLDAGVVVDIVQIGNEIGNGFLWPIGRIDSESAQQWAAFVELHNSASMAVQRISPNSKLLLHLHDGGNSVWVAWWMTQAQKHGLLATDYIGVSYYPNWHGSLDQLKETLIYLTSQNHKVWIVETAYPWTPEFFGNDIINPYQARLSGYKLTPAGQAKYVRSLRKLMKGLHASGMGIIWWEGLAINVGRYGRKFKSGMQNSTLFDDTGRMLPALQQLGKS